MAQESPVRMPVPRLRGSGITALDENARAALTRAIIVRHWDNAALARAAGIATGTVSNVRTGRRVRSEVLERIAAALEANPPDPAVEALLGGTIR